MTLAKNTVVALIILITTSAGAVAGYFIGMKNENRRLNALLRDTHTQLTGVIQDDTTANLLFSFEYLIAYVSTFMRLKPGDLISTGTPIGRSSS